MRGRILIVDDDKDMCELIGVDLRSRGYDAVCCISAQEALAALSKENPDVVLTDLNMPEVSGVELCDRIATNRPDIPVVVITAFGSLETAVAAIRSGAYDFVTKPIEMDLLAVAVERAVSHRALQEKVRLLSEAVEQPQGFGELLGASPPMKHLYAQLARIADTDTTVLITGESGTGKELVARALHKLSRRRAGPFVAINCAALPDALMESELFGHERGAFTDARTTRRGLFQQAEGGTVLLDEIGDLSLAVQPRLLRALEERRIRPLGGECEIPFNIRVIAATNHDLESAVEDGQFRQDLYFRINVVKLELPPLRSRGSDILLLAQHFIRHYATLNSKNVVGSSAPVAERLLAYAWPGNVRQLRNSIEHAVALTRYEQIAVEDLPEHIRTYRSSDILVGTDDPSGLLSMEEVERRYVLHVLTAVGGNRTQAARVLGFDRKTLYRKLQRFGAMPRETE